jgi:outer membrane scaffolding protein for murein synthesis (MipA/OmpV family)
MRHTVSLVLLLLAGNAMAQESLPTLEVGAGVLALSLPDYRGSRRSSTRVFPIPYLKYRGEHLRVDEGARGVFFESEDLSISLSTNLALVGENDTPDRKGMDDLDSIIEIGPSLNYRFHKLKRSALWLDLPFRFAYTLDSSFDHVGEIFQPRISWRKPERHLGDWKFRASIGPLLASKDYHAYYYSVDSADATPSRPAYDTSGGYSGFRGEFTYSKRIGSFWLGGFIRYDDLHNSKIEDSPLVTTADSWMGGVAVAWVFYQR